MTNQITKTISLLFLIGSLTGVVLAQSHAKVSRARAAAICGNPKIACRTSVTFEPHDLPFRVPANAVILDTDPFYVIILKSVTATDDQCDVFVPEEERLSTQLLFPAHKVFTSRCAEPGELFYTNIKDNQRIMAVYAGSTMADAKSMLAAVKLTGKFPGANIRRIRTGFNGT
ncbi:MAG TPA: hypothetical protein VJT50_10910 [Pyrinomonadaceae bacterium]|nr:hypothetical protein [Pyrinomonadaceae bacterium]